MSHSERIPKVRTECIPYIEGCGWKFSHYKCLFGMRWYIFKAKEGLKTMGGNDTVLFTLTEIRHAFLNGW